MNKFILILLSLLMIGCASQQKLAKRHLKKQGYKYIDFYPYKECICSNGDIYYIGFTAVKDSDTVVEGVIWRKHKYLRKYGISLD